MKSLEELAALRELEAAREAQEAEDDHTLPELEEDGESGLTFPEDYAHMTDEEVVRLCQHSDSVAQEYLFNKYKNFVRSKARSYFLIGADHEDIVQEGMIGLYKAIRDYRTDKQASAPLRSCASPGRSSPPSRRPPGKSTFP